MKYWLMKSEPEVFSVEDLRRAGNTNWDGVRNYRARNFMKEQRKGDRAFFYHSGHPAPAIAGVMEITREAYPDPTQFDPRSEYYDPGSRKDNPRWVQVNVRYLSSFIRTLPLKEIKMIPALKRMLLLAHSRLSVMPVSAAAWRWILCRGQDKM